MNSTYSIKRIVKAFGYSLQGLAYAYKNEAAFRQELILCVLLTPLAFWIADNAVELSLLLLTLYLILVVEILNSAIEAVVDRFGGEIHPLSGAAKDMASAAVLITFAIMIIVWVCLLIF